jgi:hypothetical protein
MPRLINFRMNERGQGGIASPPKDSISRLNHIDLRIMGRQLPAEIIHRMIIRIESVEKVAVVAEAVNSVLRNSAYKT